MIKGLDGLRAIAFLLVFTFHAHFIMFGWLGVQLFFVLSGFLITSILLDMKDTLEREEYFKKFYGRRILRIFPLYYVYLILMGLASYFLILAKFKPNYLLRFQQQLPYAFLYIYDFFNASSAFNQSKLLTHFWSLSVEEQFYIVWPLLIFLTPKRVTKKLFFGVVLAGPIFRILIYLLYQSHPFSFLGEGTAEAIYVLPFSHVDAFGLGALITQVRIPRPRLQLAVLSICVPAAGLLADRLVTGSWGSIWGLGYPLAMPGAYKPIWGYSLINYLFALTIYCVVIRGVFVKFLESRIIRYLGKISYGLYVYHLPIIWFTENLLYHRLSLSMGPLALKSIALILTIVIASISYYGMEKPIIGLKDRFFPLKAGGGVAPASIASQR